MVVSSSILNELLVLMTRIKRNSLTAVFNFETFLVTCQLSCLVGGGGAFCCLKSGLTDVSLICKTHISHI